MTSILNKMNIEKVQNAPCVSEGFLLYYWRWEEKSSSLKSKEDKMRIEKSKNSDMWFVYSNGIMVAAFANLNGAKDYCRKLHFRMRDVVIVK